jgi:hypothetical protein
MKKMIKIKKKEKEEKENEKNDCISSTRELSFSSKMI